MKTLLLLLLVTPHAYAQAATVAVFASTATDANTATPLGTPVSYQTPLCNQPLGTEVLPIVNPALGFYPDPANAARECRLTIQPQFAAVPVGSGYRAAVKVGTAPYGALSTAFAVAVQAHPCDSTPASPLSVIVGQAFTIGWCHSLRDTNGATTTITAWRVYRNGVLVTSTPVVGTTANAAGLRYVTLARTETAAAATVTYEVSAVNATGEGTRSLMPIIGVAQPAAVPAAPSAGRVTVP